MKLALLTTVVVVIFVLANSEEESDGQQIQANPRGFLDDIASTINNAIKAANNNSAKARSDLANSINKASESTRDAIQNGINTALKTFNGTLENLRQAQNATRAAIG